MEAYYYEDRIIHLARELAREELESRIDDPFCESYDSLFEKYRKKLLDKQLSKQNCFADGLALAVAYSSDYINYPEFQAKVASLKMNPDSLANEEITLQEHLELNDSFMQRSFDLGQKLLKKGRRDHAEQIFFALCQLNPFEADYWFNLSLCYTQSRNYERAQESLDAAMEVEPHEIKYMISKAELFRLQGEMSLRDDCYEKAIHFCQTVQPKAKREGAIQLIQETQRRYG